MPKFNLCIVQGKCHYKVWAFHSSFILTIAEACLGLMDSLTKVPFPVFFLFFYLLRHPSMGLLSLLFQWIVVGSSPIRVSLLFTHKGWTQLNNLPDGSHQTPPTADDASWDQPEAKYRLFGQNAQVLSSTQWFLGTYTSVNLSQLRLTNDASRSTVSYYFLYFMTFVYIRCYICTRWI